MSYLGVTLGNFAGNWWGNVNATSAAAVSAPSPGGVRRSRFLRRGPRLPGYDPEPKQPAVVVREQHRRKRVRAPLIEYTPLPDLAIPHIPETVPSATRIYVPELGTAVLAEIENEDELILHAIFAEAPSKRRRPAKKPAAQGITDEDYALMALLQ